MGDALQDLEELDNEFQQLLPLLQQADQAIEKVLAISAAYHEAHGEKVQEAPKLHEALADIQVNMHHVTDKHLQLAAQIDLAKSQAHEIIRENPY
jgi:ElaB/YqjD/DUF883 family membrane-anchored ribosome-binding protein